MCTAISYKNINHYFGRTLDYHLSYDEFITISPRIYPIPFKRVSDIKSHYAIIGMATVSENFPLYYDAVNEKGLAMAGLLFPGNAVYRPYAKDMDNIAPYELIPYILGQCTAVCEAERLLEKINIISLEFSEKYPLSPMHWIISDKSSSITVEPLKSGLKIYKNPVGVLTNNPIFEIHMHNLANYMHLSPKEPENKLTDDVKLSPYSLGMGAIGLPGDCSSASRFVRAVYTKTNSASEETEFGSITQFFHILNSVYQVRGSVLTSEGKQEITQYSSCMNTDKGIYYYTTYSNSRINGVSLRRENLNSDRLISYSLIKEQEINIQN